ncbi:MAG: phosphatidylglycerophosphatase A [Desulfobacteraceae bacterium]|nr:phosphatidylglycerophosphatase A [Desulfobacteraceae bacterium]
MAKLAIAVATGGYIGRIPFAPGTFGSLPGLLFYYIMSVLRPGAAAGLLAVVIALGIWSSGRAEILMDQKDPGSVVIDEIAGMGVVFIGLPFSMPLAAAGFILFRSIDIIKPFPIRWIETRLPGGTGVVADDLAAGLICRIILGIAGLVLAAFSKSCAGV